MLVAHFQVSLWSQMKVKAPNKDVIRKWFKENAESLSNTLDSEVMIWYEGFDQGFQDSADASPENWQEYGDGITFKLWELYKHPEKIDIVAIVLIHGTDTLAYTASALSFILRIGRPLVLTGSQYPLLGHTNSDAELNLRGALKSAWELEKRSCNNSCHIFFNGKILRANRVRKRHANFVDAFHPVNCLPLGIMQGEQLLLNESFLRSLYAPQSGVISCLELCGNICSVRLFPGCSELLSEETLNKFKVVILQAYGSGNGPKGLRKMIASETLSKTTTFLATTECYGGKTERHYATDLNSKNCITLLDITPESAFTKACAILYHFRGKEWTEEVNDEKMLEMVRELFISTMRRYVYVGKFREQLNKHMNERLIEIAICVKQHWQKVEEIKKRYLSRRGSPYTYVMKQITLQYTKGQASYKKSPAEDDVAKLIKEAPYQILVDYLSGLEEYVKQDILESCTHIEILFPGEKNSQLLQDLFTKDVTFFEWKQIQSFQLRMSLSLKGELTNEDSRKAKDSFLLSYYL
jgi:L-asparaginase